MPKQLFLMRHAKSDWEAGLSDFERPLNKRGNETALFMGKYCLENDLVPDLIIASPANRAKTTARLFAEQANYQDEIPFCEAFYFGYRTEILKRIQETTDSVQQLMIVGHNPTWSDLSLYFSGIYIEMSTAHIVVLELNSESWLDAKPSAFKFLKSLKPNDLKTN